MQSTTSVPKRVVLRFLEEYELEEWDILQAYFALFGPEPVDDFFSHLIPANESSKMHIVLDLHCKSVPIVDLQAIEYQVFKVKKGDGLYAVISPPKILANQQVSNFKELNESACKYARHHSQLIFWGTDRRYPEESDGVRL
jgi:hypothetical protein